MNDQLLMNNYLLVLKSTVEVYVHGTLESSNEDVRKLLKSSLNMIIDMQGNTYNEMVKYDWYKTNNVEFSKISEVLNCVKKEEK